MNFSTYLLLSATCITFMSLFSMEHSSAIEHSGDDKQTSPRTATSSNMSSSPFLKSKVRTDPLIDAIRTNNIEKFNAWFENNELNHNYQAKESPLYCSILLKRKEFIKTLLENGAVIGTEDLKIIIGNPTKENFEILKILASYVKLQNHNTNDIVSLFNETYEQLENMQLLLELDDASTSPRFAQQMNRTPQRYFFALSAFVLFASYYGYLCYEGTQNTEKK